MKARVTTIMNWFQNSTTKQKLIVGLGGLLATSLVVTGVYLAIPKNTGTPISATSNENVTVKDIETKTPTPVVSTPAESTVVQEVQATEDLSTVVENNAVTVDTPQSVTEEYYTTEDTGGRYEAPQETYSEPAYEAPAASEPAYEAPAASEPASSGGWDGNLGATKGDNSGAENGGWGVGN